jgi:hypothetical protein
MPGVPVPGTPISQLVGNTRADLLLEHSVDIEQQVLLVLHQTLPIC